MWFVESQVLLEMCLLISFSISFSSLLYSSYKQCEKLLNAVQSAGMPVIWHGHLEGEPTPTCTQCLVSSTIEHTTLVLNML